MSAPVLLADVRAGFPMWSFRSGEVPALLPASRAMGLWMLVRSCNGREMTRCSLSEASLAGALGFRNRRPVQTRLQKLRSVPGLLFEVPCGRSGSSGRRRPHARWATDPVRSHYWFNVLCNHRLPGIAEIFGLDAEWLRVQQERLRLHSHAASTLAEHIISECIDSPRTVSVQDAVGGGMQAAIEGRNRRNGPTRPRKRRKRRRGRR